MSFKVNYEMRRCKDGVNYSSVHNLYTKNQVLGSGFMLEEICCSQFASVIDLHLNLFGGMALFIDGLNFDGRPLKIVGFCKQCFDKLYALLK